MSSRAVLVAALLHAVLAGAPEVPAQPAARIPIIGYLSVSTRAIAAPMSTRSGKDCGSSAIYGEARSERLPELARELRDLKVDVIVTANDVATAAVKRETQAIPIVMANSID